MEIVLLRRGKWKAKQRVVWSTGEGDAGRWKNIQDSPCRGPLPRLAKTASASQKAKQGISIRDSWSEKGKKKKTPVVGKGKSKVFEKPPQIAYDAIQDPKLPWEGVCIANDTPEDSSKISDMYIEGIDGQFGLAKVCKKKLTYNPFNFSAYISSVTEANNETCASSANEYHNDGASSDDSDVLC